MSAKALVVLPGEGAVGVREVAIPRIRDDWILVRNKAVSINPTDWKSIDLKKGDAGARSGVDYAGVVEEVGSNVKHLKKGDRVAGFSHGGNRRDHETGSFGEFVLAKARIAIKIPDFMDFAHAAAMPTSVITCGLGLFKSLGLPMPDKPAKEPFPMLIHGGSTATGMWGIQFAKAAGLTVVATASPHNFDRVKALGADAVFDYRSATCGADIRALTENKMRYAWDCVGGGEPICAAALSDAEPVKLGSINGANLMTGDALAKLNPMLEGQMIVLGYNAINETYEWNGKTINPTPDDMEFTARWIPVVLDLLEKGIVKPLDVTLNMGGGGLDGIMEGLDYMRQGKVSGQKLVYTI